MARPVSGRADFAPRPGVIVICASLVGEGLGAVVGAVVEPEVPVSPVPPVTPAGADAPPPAAGFEPPSDWKAWQATATTASATIPAIVGRIQRRGEGRRCRGMRAGGMPPRYRGSALERTHHRGIPRTAARRL